MKYKKGDMVIAKPSLSRNFFERGIGFHDLRPKQIERIYNKIFG